MITPTERQERLKELQTYISSHDSESYFDTLYSKLLAELQTEYSYNSSMKENGYLNNLRQTRDKQAAHYLETKRKMYEKQSIE